MRSDPVEPTGVRKDRGCRKWPSHSRAVGYRVPRLLRTKIRKVGRKTVGLTGSFCRFADRARAVIGHAGPRKRPRNPPQGHFCLKLQKFLSKDVQKQKLCLYLQSQNNSFGLDRKGEMPEWSIGPHSKCGVRVTVPGVRIPLSPLRGFDKKPMIPVSSTLTGIFVFRGRTSTPPCGSSSAGNSVASPSAPDSATDQRFLFTDSLNFTCSYFAHGGVTLQPVNTWSI